MIWIHNHPRFKCYIEILDQDYKFVEGNIIYIEFGGTPIQIGEYIQFSKKWGKLATEEDIKKMNKLMVFK